MHWNGFFFLRVTDEGGVRVAWQITMFPEVRSRVRYWQAEPLAVAKLDRPLAPPSARVREKAHWYNQLGCLFLEISEHCGVPLVAPVFPFYHGDPTFALTVVATILGDIDAFQIPLRDLPRLTSVSGVRFRMTDGFIWA